MRLSAHEMWGDITQPHFYLLHWACPLAQWVTGGVLQQQPLSPLGSSPTVDFSTPPTQILN